MAPLPSAPTPERRGFAMPGFMGLLFVLVVAGLGVALIVVGAMSSAAGFIIAGIPIALLGLACFAGMFTLEPNQAVVLVLFGTYKGTIRESGWHWTNPLAKRYQINLRVNNFNSERLKVNDADGNPIEIAAVVVWRVVDTARATFDVENYQGFIHVQAETAIRHLASQYPYDNPTEKTAATLRGSQDEIAEAMRRELQSRLTAAGIEIVEARFSHLAYSAEIAAAMLQRQQAQAIVAARQRIVQGAVGIAEAVLESLRKQKIVELTTTQKAELVSRLLIVLASERGAQPVLQVQ